MNWFTIYVSEPQSDLAAKCQKNSAGQFILFDGRTTSQDIRSRAKEASLRCYESQVFTGKRLGKIAIAAEKAGDTIRAQEARDASERSQ